MISINALTIARLVQTLFNFYSFLIFAYCLLSWFPIRSGSLMEDIGAVLQSIVGPYLNLFRRFLPPMGELTGLPFLRYLC